MALADVERLAADLYVVELDAEHVLQLHIVPVDLSRELGLVVVAESQVGPEAARLLSHRGHIEGEYVRAEELLLHHVVEHRRHALLSQLGVGHADDGLEVGAGEDVLLLQHIAKFLSLDVHLARGFAVARAESDVVYAKDAREVPRAELNECLLLSGSEAGGGFLLERKLLGSRQLRLVIKHPNVGRARIEETSDLLRRVAHIHFCDVGAVCEVDLEDVCFHGAVSVEGTVRRIAAATLR